MTWKIKAIAGPFVGQEVIIDQDKVIGRDQSVDIVLQGGHISRRHAVLSVQDEALWIRDLNSSNGTFVNGQRINEQQLELNDEIQIDVVRFLVLNTLNESLREKTTESVSLTEEGRPSHVSIPKPAPMPAQQIQSPPESVAPQPSAQSPVQKTGFKNTLPAAIAMAIFILLIIMAVWHFIV
ncbi:FHA domain-containing protein [Alkanindiges sp. WGS2144]|uniref:FHA domain-containing protein n=1 Tax=Alkanindiges sp. WGS2144 TaxID=3366808 RepID=UPI0037522FD7